MHHHGVSLKTHLYMMRKHELSLSLNSIIIHIMLSCAFTQVQFPVNKQYIVKKYSHNDEMYKAITAVHVETLAKFKIILI